MQHIIDTFATHLPEFAAESRSRIHAADLSSYNALSVDQLLAATTAAMRAFQADLVAGTTAQFPAHWERVAKTRVQQGVTLDHMQLAILTAQEVMHDYFLIAYADDPAALAWWSRRLQQLIGSGILALSQVFTAAREDMIREQAAQLRELSTPIIPLYTGVLAVPLVGTIDSHRAAQIMEALLEGIAREQANVVIIDITGVPMVDTQVANYLIQAARMARLLGSQAVLVGIGPEIAQTIVQLGVDLSDVTTQADLEAGIEYALGLRGLAIRPLGRTERARAAQYDYALN